jgi:hypothetical protein
VPKPEPKRREVRAFASPEDADAVAVELAADYAAISVLPA